MRNLRKFNTESEYNSATLNYPAVSWVVSDDIVHFDKENPTPSFSGLTVYYNITDISQPTTLFKGGGGSGSGSGSGSGGVLPSEMIIDGTAVEVTNTYQFSATGEHIVNYSFADNQIPNEFLSDGTDSGIFSTVTKIVIGDALTTIGDYAFNNCSGLTSINIPSGVTSIGDSAFNGCSSLTSVTIPDSVTSIGQYAFNGCSSLTSVDIPSGVTSIGSNAFAVCSSLTSINIPTGVTSINDSVFFNCRSLTSITIPNSVTSIGGTAFYDCSSLTSIDIPSVVTSIGTQTFYNCTSLTSIIVNPTTPPTLGSAAFDNTTCPILVSSQSLEAYKNAWSQYASRIQAIQ